jgi:hypothetical protein
VDVKKVYDGEDTMRVPVVRFTPAGSGAEIEFDESTQSNISLLSRGQRVEVLYDPCDPKDATIAGWRQYFVPTVLALLAVLALAGSLKH